ncbi:Transposon Tf2-9 polyprotein [Labeo rohita]|uniref:Transposon Tf2-9 polyprotein n=1 Tax=Labeo rohita TaxID=84645 RepID=A0ABQ8L5E2_LABRO|nr:Transposon Tf2-9 polyprotein [Labeo rohita]
METAEALCNSVFRFYGLPENIISDRGPQFTSRLWSDFFNLLGVNVSLTSGYHPQANGQAERLNQKLTRFLRSYCQDHQEDWSRFLLWAEYAQNSIRKPSTNLTPFQCVLGYQPPLFPWSGEPSDLPAVNSWFQRSEETWNRAHVHLQRAIHRTRTQADRRRRAGPSYEPGQWVWLSTRDLRLRLPCKKLSPRYVGPFRIIHQITPVSFRLELPPEYRISPTFHMSLLKPAGRPGGAENLEETAPQGPSPLIIDGEEVYRVNTILDSRRWRGRLQYLVDWEDYGPEERSTRTPWKGKTPAPVTSSCQEALAGGGSVTRMVSVAETCCHNLLGEGDPAGAQSGTTPQLGLTAGHGGPKVHRREQLRDIAHGSRRNGAASRHQPVSRSPDVYVKTREDTASTRRL